MGLTSEDHLALSCNSSHSDRSVTMASLGCTNRTRSGDPSEVLTNLRREGFKARDSDNKIVD